MSFYRNINTELYYEIHGQGQPFLIIPGGGTDGRYYLSIVNLLKEHFMVILPDPRGTGRSEMGTKEYSFDLLSSDMRALLDHLNVESAFVMGHSMGGMVAQHFTYHYPSYAKKIILFATSNQLTAFGRHCCRTVVVAKNETSVSAFVHIMSIWNFSEQFFSEDKNISDLISATENDPYPIKSESLVEQMKIIEDFDSSDYLGDIVTPSLIIGCENDIVFSPASIKRLKSLIPHAQLHEIPEATHSAHIEQPQTIVEVVVNYLKEK